MLMAMYMPCYSYLITCRSEDLVCISPTDLP